MALTTLANVKEYLGITNTDSDALLTNLIDRASSAIETFCKRIFGLTSYREFYDGERQSEVTLSNFPVVTVTLLGVGREAAFGIQNTSSDAYNAQVSISDTEIQVQVFGGTNEDDTSLTLANYSTLSSLYAAILALNKGWSITEYAFNAWSPIELLPTGKGLQCLNDIAEPDIPSEPESDFVTDTKAGILKYFGYFYEGFQNVVVRYSAGYATIPPDLEQICIDLVKVYYDSSGTKINSNMKSEKIGDYEYEAGGTAQMGTTSASGIPPTIAGRLRVWMTRV